MDGGYASTRSRPAHRRRAAALFGIPIDPDELARRYTLETADLDLINQRRLDRNRLGVALQVALLRHPGMPLAQVKQIEGGAPAPLAAFLARQLGLSPAALADYAGRTQTMTDHARLVADAVASNLVVSQRNGAEISALSAS